MEFKTCVYAICKNERDSIPIWLEHVKMADAIVVLDTGSTDGSYEYLKKVQSSDEALSGKLFIGRKTWDDVFNFSEARNTALADARRFIYDELGIRRSDHVIFITLDFDEFLEEGGIEKIKERWDPSYDVMLLNGITGKNVETVEHKIHSDNIGWKWERMVHEVLKLDGRHQKDWKRLNSEVTYMHIKDHNKKRDYCKILLEEYHNTPSDIKTNMYLAWEYYNIGDYKNYYKFTSQTLNLLSANMADELYLDPEYTIQCYFNFYNYRVHYGQYKEAIKELTKIIEILLEGTFPYFRKVYYLYAETLWKLAETGGATDEFAAKEESIKYYKKCLEIKVRPYSWVEDDTLYDDGLIYSTISRAYFYMGRGDKDYRKSLEYINYALEDSPTNDMYMMQQRICLEKLGTNEEKSIKGVSPSKDTTQNKICVYAISKNERQFVDKWYNSMKEADYIVVLDTGSTDGTVTRLQQLGVTVQCKKIVPWRFDVARNESMKLIPDDANILVCTDLDEELEPGWAAELRANWIEGVHERAVYKYAWSHLNDGSPGRVFQYDKIHSRDWKWKFPVHETLWHTERDSNMYSIEKTLNLFDRIYLHHYPDKTKSRSSYLPLLELRAEENPDDHYGLIYLAHEYTYRKYYDKSIDTLKRIICDFSDKITDLEKASCYLFMGDAYKELEKYNDAISCYQQAIRIEGTYREPYLNLAKLYHEKEEYELAIGYVKTALRQSYRHFTWLERDTSWSYEPYDILCQACFYGGHKKDSIVYAAKALSYDKTNQRLGDNLDICIRLTDNSELL